MEQRKYKYKGNIYSVIDECRMKDSNGWTDAVIYKDINNEEKGKFVRSKEQFLDRFIPDILENGDKVLVISMGKKVGVDEVDKIDKNNNTAHLKILGIEIPIVISDDGYITSRVINDYFFFNKVVEKDKVLY